MASSKDTATITYGDHEVIMPDNKLRHVISSLDPSSDEEHPVVRAESALAGISGEFGTWMNEECERLDGARDNVKTDSLAKSNKDALFRAALDIKSQAATFGFPLLAAAANSLCRLIEHTPLEVGIPLMLVDQHVDAIRAIYREYTRSDIGELAAKLTQRLREVTDEFLIRENRDRPHVLARILDSSIAPE
jgi:HPt (histidine-containing phosphotransfer) domain-containing protein